MELLDSACCVCTRQASDGGAIGNKIPVSEKEMLMHRLIYQLSFLVSTFWALFKKPLQKKKKKEGGRERKRRGEGRGWEGRGREGRGREGKGEGEGDTFASPGHEVVCCVIFIVSPSNPPRIDFRIWCEVGLISFLLSTFSFFLFLSLKYDYWTDSALFIEKTALSHCPTWLPLFLNSILLQLIHLNTSESSPFCLLFPWNFNLHIFLGCSLLSYLWLFKFLLFYSQGCNLHPQLRDEIYPHVEALSSARQIFHFPIVLILLSFSSTLCVTFSNLPFLFLSPALGNSLVPYVIKSVFFPSSAISLPPFYCPFISSSIWSHRGHVLFNIFDKIKHVFFCLFNATPSKLDSLYLLPALFLFVLCGYHFFHLFIFMAAALLGFLCLTITWTISHVISAHWWPSCPERGEGNGSGSRDTHNLSILPVNIIMLKLEFRDHSTLSRVYSPLETTFEFGTACEGAWTGFLESALPTTPVHAPASRQPGNLHPWTSLRQLRGRQWLWKDIVYPAGVINSPRTLRHI